MFHVVFTRSCLPPATYNLPSVLKSTASFVRTLPPTFRAGTPRSPPSKSKTVFFPLAPPPPFSSQPIDSIPSRTNGPPPPLQLSKSMSLPFSSFPRRGSSAKSQDVFLVRNHPAVRSDQVGSTSRNLRPTEPIRGHRFTTGHPHFRRISSSLFLAQASPKDARRRRRPELIFRATALKMGSF